MESNKKIGLALGGGVALGAAHVGVLKALDEADIKIDYITGTSVGAFVAAFVAFGNPWQDIKEIALNLKWIDIANISLSRYGLLANEKIGELIIENIGDRDMEDSNIPLAMTATNAANGEKITLKKGSVAEAVMASTCIPGIFKPIEKGDLMLVDGGIVENVPINTTKQLGAEFIIGVDLNAKYSYEKPDNIFDVILNSFHFIMKQSTKIQTEDADLLIEPDLSKYSRSDINQIEKMIKRGYKDAKTVLERMY
jgi:NTE family protein